MLATEYRHLHAQGLAFLVSSLSTAQLSEDLRTACKQTLLSDEGRRCLQELPENVFKNFVPQTMVRFMILSGTWKTLTSKVLS